MIMSIFKLPLSLAIKSMENGDIKFNATHKTFGDFNVKKDLQYISDDTRAHRLDIYTNPVKQNGITLFYVHGGGYVYGHKEDHRIFVSWFVNQGFSVVAINYRLGKKDGSISIMDQVNDALATLDFVEKNKYEYGIDTKNLFPTGDSAGGHICLMVDILYKSQSARDFYQIKELPNVDIKGVAVNSTMYDYEGVVKMARSMLYKRGCRWMLSTKYLDEEFIKKNSPRCYYKNGLKPSPLFASSSYHDYFNMHTLKLHRDSEELGIPVDYLFESSTNKKVGHVYNHFVFDLEEGKKCNERMVSFFINNSKVDN